MSDRGSKRSRTGPADGKSSRRMSKGNAPSQSGPDGVRSSPYLNPISSTMPPPSHTNFPPQGKMLLPPLRRPASNADSSKLSEKNRTAHACEKCRKSKAKCSGGLPCEKCKNEGKECLYGDGKRDAEKKALQKLSRDKQRLVKYNEKLKEKLLFICQMESQKQLSAQDILDTQSLLFNYKDTDYDSSYDSSDGADDSNSSHGEDAMSGGVGSTDSIDIIHEDTNRDEQSRATGFMGKSSAVSWMQRAKKEANHGEGGLPNAPNFGQNQYIDSSYLAEDSDLPGIDEDTINPFELPPPEVARTLVNYYFLTTHDSCPVLSRRDFMFEFDRFSKGAMDGLLEKEPKWLCLLNIVFAIASRYSHVMVEEWRGDDRDHLLYIARSKRLGMDARTFYKNPELNHTTNLCLLGLYFLSTDEINKAWTIIGVAIRNSMALGLHVRSKAEELTSRQKQLRVRLWWSIYSMERVLDDILGRPSGICDRDISAPLPTNVEEDDIPEDGQSRGQEPYNRSRESTRTGSTKGKSKLDSTHPSLSPVGNAALQASIAGSPPYSAFSFPLQRLPVSQLALFVYRVQLAIITHEIITQLYCAAMIKATWGEVEHVMTRLDGRLKDWKMHLPAEYNFEATEMDSRDGRADIRAGLSLAYNAARMALFRPCLCRFQERIKNESQKSKIHNSKAVIGCIKAARAVIQAIPSEDPKEIFAIMPWVNTVHHIIQAGGILMLELAYRAEHVPSQAAKLVTDSRRAVTLLSAMSHQSISARKGWEVLDGLLRVVAPRVAIDVSDMPISAPLPYSWRYTSYSPETYQGQPASYREDYSGVSALNTNAWVEQNAYGMMPPFSSDSMGTMYAQGPAFNFGQLYGTTMQPYGLAGHMKAHDEFDPFQSAFFPDNTNTNFTTPRTGGEGFPAATMSMQGLDITSPVAGNYITGPQGPIAAPVPPGTFVPHVMDHGLNGSQDHIRPDGYSR